MENFKKYIDEFRNLIDGDSNSNLIETMIKVRDGNGGSTILHYMCEKDDTECITRFLNEARRLISPKTLTTFVNSQDDNGNTPLHISTLNENNMLSSILEVFGAKINNENNKQQIVVPVTKSEAIRQITQASSDDNSSKVESPLPPIKFVPVSPEQHNKNISTNSNMSGGSSRDMIDRLQEKLRRLQHGGGRKKKEEEVKEKKPVKEKKTVKEEKQLTEDKKQSSSDIHSEVIEIIRNLGYSEDDARVLKAGLYALVKQTHPELKNYERALKMKEYAKNKKYLAKIDISEVKKAIEIHRENKKSQNN